MLLNNINIGERNNRPIVMSKVGLQAFFISDGLYTDPYQISSVTIFKSISNMDPSTVLNTDELINTSAVSGSILMNFANSSTLTTNSAFDTSNYTSQNASGIFKISTGRYIVILDGATNTSGYINLNGVNRAIANTASSTGDYIDVWTVNMAAGSKLQTVINNFTLRKGGFTVVTQPVMIKTKNRLINSKITLGSKCDIKIGTDVHIENADIDESVKTLFRDNVVTSGALEIQKLNDAANLPARVTVSSFAQTSALTDITSDNVLTFTWDTSLLSTHPQLVAGNFGSIQGIYAIRARYTVFNDTIVSDPMYLTLS